MRSLYMRIYAMRVFLFETRIGAISAGHLTGSDFQRDNHQANTEYCRNDEVWDMPVGRALDAGG